MTRLLLLGASGFLGRHVRHRLATTATVICPSRQEWDLATVDVEELADRLRVIRPQAVVSCVGAVTGDSRRLIQRNVVATVNLVEAIAIAAPDARLVRLGSAAEYGPVPHGHPAGETDPAAPVSEYGVSQLAATRLVELAGHAGRVDGVVLRVFNPIGPGIPEESLFGRVLALIQQARATGMDQIRLGHLGAYRDLVDVRDVAGAVAAAVSVPTLTHRVYNVASGRAVRVRDVVREVAQSLGFTGEIRESAACPTRSAQVAWMCADVSRARRDLGWAPTRPLAESLAAIADPVASLPPAGIPAMVAPRPALTPTTVRPREPG